MSKKSPDSPKPSIERQIARGAWWLTKGIGKAALGAALLTAVSVVNLVRDEKVSRKPLRKHFTEGVPDEPDVEREVTISPYHQLQEAAKKLIEMSPEEREVLIEKSNQLAQQDIEDHQFGANTEGMTPAQTDLVVAEQASKHATYADPSQ